MYVLGTYAGQRLKSHGRQIAGRMLKARNLPLLLAIGASVAIAAAVTGITLYYSLMPAWMSVEVSGETFLDENGSLAIKSGERDRDVSNATAIGDSDLERLPALQRAIERADEMYPAVPTGFSRLSSQSEARAIIELLRIENERGGDDRGLFIYGDRAYYIHITYGYEQPVSV